MHQIQSNTQKTDKINFSCEITVFSQKNFSTQAQLDRFLPISLELLDGRKDYFIVDYFKPRPPFLRVIFLHSN